MKSSAPSGWRWQTHADVASTQDCAIEAARAGEFGRLAVLADRQTDGRGSRGRSWVAPAGNLNLSLLLRPGRVRPNPGYWAMLAGVALYEALAPFATGLLLKWPNDLLRDGGKLGGILIDSAVDDSGMLEWVVIGIGVNLLHAPRLDGPPAACLGAASPGPSVIAPALLAAVDAFAMRDIRAEWLSRAHPPGTVLCVDTPRGRVRAPFNGLSERGELLLAGVEVPISSAEVFLAWPRDAATQLQPCC